MTQIPIENLGVEFKRIIDEAGKHNAEVIAKTIKDMPSEFDFAAELYYPLVLKVRSGQLKQNIAGFSRRISPAVIEVGLRDIKEYAWVQHEGFDGEVNVPAHIRHIGFLGKRGGRIKTTGSAVGTFISWVKAHTRHMRIKPKKFLETPMRAEANKILKEMMRKFGFGKSK